MLQHKMSRFHIIDRVVFLCRTLNKARHNVPPNLDKYVRKAEDLIVEFLPVKFQSLTSTVTCHIGVCCEITAHTVVLYYRTQDLSKRLPC